MAKNQKYFTKGHHQMKSLLLSLLNNMRLNITTAPKMNSGFESAGKLKMERKLMEFGSILNLTTIKT